VPPARDAGPAAPLPADGKVYCLLDAPDEQAIRQHHAALGVPCSDVHQVDSLM
jgi:Protein of unknown function (DUF4242)